tara:strand:- start:3486 stop:4703 length:1218 start_codon:yes stop_codon:yes gene_type:complete
MSSSNTDFDATLVDWLYGELDSDATARFEAHLETHPEHKAEAHALRDTRMAFQELPQAEPSHALTAVLMQQAAASAQPSQGLWASIVGFFQPLVMHPATAALATIVLVAGVAGTLYVRNGNIVSEPSVVSSNAERPSDMSRQAAAPEGAAPTSSAKLESLARGESEMDGESPVVAANDTRGYAADIATAAQEERLQAALAKTESKPQQARSKEKKSKDASGAPVGLRVTGDSDAFAFDSTSNAISGGAFADSTQKSGIKSPGKKNKVVSRGLVGGSTTETVAPAPEPKASKSAAPARKPQSWESKQVADFQVAARGKRCRDAGRIAIDLKEKSPLAYKENVKGSPEESDCSYYIASETKRRKTARSKRAASKSKKTSTPKGQGKSVPKKALAAPQESFDENASGL